MSVERAERHVQAVQWLAQPVAAVAALLVLFWALSVPHYFSLMGPLWAVAGFLGLGLAAGPLAQLVSGLVPKRAVSSLAVHRFAQPVAAVGALLALFWELLIPRDWYTQISPMGQLWAIAVLLGLGLVADPLARLVGGRPARTSARAVQGAVQAVAAFAALLALFWALSGPHYFSPMAPLWAIAVLLGLGLVSDPLARLASGRTAHGSVSGRAVQRFAQPVASVAALLALFWELLAPHSWFSQISPMGPLWAIAVFLGLGLAAGPLAQLAGRPRERMLSERVDELSRTRGGVLDVQASELRRIERDLHDGAQVRLVALSMKLGRAEDRYRDDPQTAALLREAREDAAAAIRDLRELARGIAPPVLTDRGLQAAVRSLAARSGIAVEVIASLARRPVPAVETAAYFVVAESLTNAAKHAPGARVEVRLDERGGGLFVEVTDFGPGGADPAGGGLTGLRQRVEALDGALHVTSPAGVGTQVEAVLPCGR